MTAAAIDVAMVRGKLRGVADQIRADIAGREKVDARVLEWGAVALEYRMALLLLAGCDGDLSVLARKAWSEFTPPEKIAIQVAARGMWAALECMVALRARAA